VKNSRYATTWCLHSHVTTLASLQFFSLYTNCTYVVLQEHRQPIICFVRSHVVLAVQLEVTSTLLLLYAWHTQHSCYQLAGRHSESSLLRERHLAVLLRTSGRVFTPHHRHEGDARAGTHSLSVARCLINKANRPLCIEGSPWARPRLYPMHVYSCEGRGRKRPVSGKPD
jgi:hypothetical protein